MSDHQLLELRAVELTALGRRLEDAQAIAARLNANLRDKEGGALAQICMNRIAKMRIRRTTIIESGSVATKALIETMLEKSIEIQRLAAEVCGMSGQAPEAGQLYDHLLGVRGYLAGWACKDFPPPTMAEAAPERICPVCGDPDCAGPDGHAEAHQKPTRATANER